MGSCVQCVDAGLTNPVLNARRSTCERGNKLGLFCLQADYCSEKHQRADWKAGHKSVCKGGSSSALPSKSSLLLPEGLIESEPEPKKEGKGDTGQNIDQYR